MLKTIPILAVLTILPAESRVQSASTQAPPDKLFLLGDDHRKEWCAYASESSWK